MKQPEKLTPLTVASTTMTLRYARLWMTISTGEVPGSDIDIRTWYSEARHAIGSCMHEADMDRVLADIEVDDPAVKTAA